MCSTALDVAQVVEHKAEDVLGRVRAVYVDDRVLLVDLFAARLVLGELLPGAQVEVAGRVGDDVVATLAAAGALLLVEVDEVASVEHVHELGVVVEQYAVEEDPLVEAAAHETAELDVKLGHVDGRDHVEVERVELGYVLVVALVSLVVEVVLRERDRVGYHVEQFL